MYKPIIRGINRIFGLKFISNIKNGMTYTMPFTIIGSIFLLLNQISILNPVSEFLNLGYSFSFGILGIIAALGISYNISKDRVDPFICIIITFISFMILCGFFSKQTQTISIDWLGSKGIFAGIIIGSINGYLYLYLLDSRLKFKFSESLPTQVENAFNSLIPGFILVLLSIFINMILIKIFNSSFPELIYLIIQIPLQNISDSFIGILILTILISVFWFFGIQGSTIISGFITPLLITNSLENQAWIDAGIDSNLHIVTYQFINQFVSMSGAGITLGLVISILYFSRRKDFKSISKVSLIPSIFNINEPIVFGIPVILNQYLLIPFILVPVITTILLYVSIDSGLLPHFNGIMLPWITPPIISGFLLGDVKYAIFQVIILFISCIIYLPFLKKLELKMNDELNENIN